jgi:hypothetical protein
MKIFIALFLILIKSFIASAQSNNTYETAKAYATQIGYFDNVKFVEVGSGLLSYIKYKGQPRACIITARHIVDSLLSWQRTPYVRPSWGDSIKTTEWIGIKTPLIQNGTNMYFVPSNPNIDIAIIILGKTDRTSTNYYRNSNAFIFPLNSILNPELGDNVIVVGYPQHVENAFTKYNYSVCTIKPGMVSWIANYKINSEIDNLMLIDCNATFGNSGGPVFGIPALGGLIPLIGIQSQIYWDDPIVIDPTTGKAVIPSLKKAVNIQITRSGVALVVKAQVIRDLLDDINNTISSDDRYSFLHNY